MILNGRGLSQPPPFLPRMTCAPLSSHLNTPTPPTTHRLPTSATMSSFSGTHLRSSPSGRHRRSLWISSSIIVLNSSRWPRTSAYLAMIWRSQPSLFTMASISSPGMSPKQSLPGMRLHDPLYGRQACPEFIAFDQGVGQIYPR